jgi:hypothetical protein
VRRSAQERRELIEVYRASGLGKAAFCRRHGLHLATFCAWFHRRSLRGPAGKAAAFAEVILPMDGPTGASGESAASDARLRIDLPRGLCVRVYDVSTLKDLAPFIREVLAC